MQFFISRRASLAIIGSIIPVLAIDRLKEGYNLLFFPSVSHKGDFLPLPVSWPKQEVRENSSNVRESRGVARTVPIGKFKVNPKFDFLLLDNGRGITRFSGSWFKP